MSATDQLAQRLDELRQAKQVSYTELAAEIGINRVTISKIVARTQIDVSLNVAAKIAAATGISLDALYQDPVAS